MTFAEKIVRLRKSNRLSQEAFAQSLGITRQAVYKWECGDSYADAERLLLIRKLYGVSIDDLLVEEHEIRFEEKEPAKRHRTPASSAAKKAPQSPAPALTENTEDAPTSAADAAEEAVQTDRPQAGQQQTMSAGADVPVSEAEPTPEPAPAAAPQPLSAAATEEPDVEEPAFAAQERADEETGVKEGSAESEVLGRAIAEAAAEAAAVSDELTAQPAPDAQQKEPVPASAVQQQNQAAPTPKSQPASRPAAHTPAPQGKPKKHSLVDSIRSFFGLKK